MRSAREGSSPRNHGAPLFALAFVANDSLAWGGPHPQSFGAAWPLCAIIGAAIRSISARTFETHVANTMAKLHLTRRADLVRFAIRHGIE
ncbi:MAG: LuxR C-terminal-related transcriptional regulator [Microthrixaceae bacterium]